MASFVPHYKKKQMQLQELEGELMAALQQQKNADLISQKLAAVRSAKIRAIKEMIAKLLPSEKSALQLKKLHAEIDACERLTSAAILKEYQAKIASFKKPIHIARAPRRGAWP